MINEIKNIIEKVYIMKDYNFFISKCHRKINFIDELLGNLQDKCKNVTLSDDLSFPSVEIYFELNDFSKGEFKVQYSSVLLISKIADVFNIRHEFAVDNLDTNRMDCVLDGFGEQAYSILQFDLDNIITEYMQKQNYRKLKYAEMVEVISEIEMPEACIYGSQMTVENAIFNDLWNICP